MYMKLKLFLVENKILYKEVAELIGVSKSSFSRKINAKGEDFSLKQVKVICETYNLDANVYFL